MDTNDSMSMLPIFFKFSSRAYLTTVAACPDLHVKAIDENTHDSNRKIYDNLLIGEYEPYSFPIVFHQYDGNRLRNVLDTGWPPVYLISDRMRDILIDNNITGWKAYTIELYDKKDRIISGYNGFSVIGRGGSYDKNYKLGYLDKEKQHFGATTRGLYNLSNWDGSDFFIMWYRELIVTERVMKLLKKNKIDAIEYEKLSDYVDYIGEPRF